MTDECHEEHEEIKTELTKMERDLEFHIGEVHSKLLPKENVLTKEEALASDSRIETKINQLATESSEDRAEIHRQLDEMGEVVLGEKHVDFDGNITRSGGMKAIVHAYENGGLKFKWANLIISVLTVLIMAIGVLATVVLQHSTDTAQVIEEVNQQLDDRLDVILGELEQLEAP